MNTFLEAATDAGGGRGKFIRKCFPCFVTGEQEGFEVFSNAVIFRCVHPSALNGRRGGKQEASLSGLQSAQHCTQFLMFYIFNIIRIHSNSF